MRVKMSEIMINDKTATRTELAPILFWKLNPLSPTPLEIDTLVSALCDQIHIFGTNKSSSVDMLTVNTITEMMK